MSEGLSEKVAKVTLDDEVELPAELKNLIEETVETTKEEVKEVTAQMLSDFFAKAAEKIQEDELAAQLEELVKGVEERQEKLDKLKSGLDPIYEKVWATFGIEYELGKNAISHHRSILQNESISTELRQSLLKGIQTFSMTEQNLVRRILLGKEDYEKEVEQEAAVQKVQKDLVAELNSMSPKEKGAMIAKLKDKGTKFRERMKSMGQEEAIKYLQNPSDEDQQLLYKLSALTMILSGGRAAGPKGQACAKPCCSHGHAAPQQPGHSHDEKPQQHGQSHDGKPCDEQSK